MKQVGFLNINWRDAAKSLILFFITTFVTSLVQGFKDGQLPTLIEIKTAAIIGLTASISYLLKNYLTNNQDQFLKPDVVESIKPAAPKDNSL